MVYIGFKKKILDFEKNPDIPITSTQYRYVRIRAKLTSHDKQIFDSGKMAEVGNGGLGLC